MSSRALRKLEEIENVDNDYASEKSRCKEKKAVNLRDLNVLRPLEEYAKKRWGVSELIESLLRPFFENILHAVDQEETKILLAEQAEQISELNEFLRRSLFQVCYTMEEEAKKMLGFSELDESPLLALLEIALDATAEETNRILGVSELNEFLLVMRPLLQNALDTFTEEAKKLLGDSELNKSLLLLLLENQLHTMEEQSYKMWGISELDESPLLASIKITLHALAGEANRLWEVSELNDSLMLPLLENVVHAVGEEANKIWGDSEVAESLLQPLSEETPPYKALCVSLYLRYLKNRGILSKMENLSQCMRNTSRYKDEFVEINRLGKGGFGSVFKVKYKLDQKEYAVKKIPLKEIDSEIYLKVLREVKVLANLSHVNVVGYHAAWLEYNASDCSTAPLHRVSTHPASLTDITGFNTFRKSESSLNDSIVFDAGETSTSDGIVFAVASNDGVDPSGPVVSGSVSRSSYAPYRSSNRHIQSSDSSCSLNTYSQRGNPMGDENIEFVSNSTDSPSIENKKSGMVLFIQMQLCATTLRSWLTERRDNRLTVPEDVDKCRILEIFRQIVNGVHYIHSRGLMHRDLKPGNIFLQNNSTRNGEAEKNSPLQVKIGDFGLARKEVVMSPGESSPLASLIEPLTPLFPTAATKDMPTVGVGTCTYASPEQLRDNVYDNKADIYSLGIIMFEMFCPFTTEMERVKCIKDLRQGAVPPEFAAQWPEEATLILEMVAEDPAKRPSAEKILEMEGLCCGNEITKQLNVKVQAQAMEICELQQKLVEKDEDLEVLTREVNKLKQELVERDELVNDLLSRSKFCHLCSNDMSFKMEISDDG